MTLVANFFLLILSKYNNHVPCVDLVSGLSGYGQSCQSGLVSLVSLVV